MVERFWIALLPLALAACAAPGVETAGPARCELQVRRTVNGAEKTECHAWSMEATGRQKFKAERKILEVDSTPDRTYQRVVR